MKKILCYAVMLFIVFAFMLSPAADAADGNTTSTEQVYLIYLVNANQVRINGTERPINDLILELSAIRTAGGTVKLKLASAAEQEAQLRTLYTRFRDELKLGSESVIIISEHLQ